MCDYDIHDCVCEDRYGEVTANPTESEIPDSPTDLSDEALKTLAREALGADATVTTGVHSLDVPLSVGYAVAAAGYVEPDDEPTAMIHVRHMHEPGARLTLAAALRAIIEARAEEGCAPPRTCCKGGGDA